MRLGVSACFRLILCSQIIGCLSSSGDASMSAGDSVVGTGGASGTATGGATGSTGGSAASGTAGIGGVAGSIAMGGAADSASLTPGGSGGAGGASNGEGSGGIAGSSGLGGAAGTTAVFTDTVPILVLGSSNELGSCWRAFLQQRLHDAGIDNFDFVGGVTEGPECGVADYDKDLQAQGGTIVTNLSEETFAGWFTAYQPALVLAHFGGADLLSNMPVSGIIEGYSRALEQARIVNPQIHFLMAQHTPQDPGAVEELNAATVTWAAENTTLESPVVAVDLYTGLDLDSDFSDRVHLNDAGSEKVADRWFGVLAPLFGH